MKIDATIASERRILDTTYPLYAVPVGLIPLPVPQICPTRFYNFTEKHYIFKEKCKKKENLEELCQVGLFTKLSLRTSSLFRLIKVCLSS